MTGKSWRLSRRAFLRGSGVSLALPFLECMRAESGPQTPPKRFAAVYFPYGVVARESGAAAAEWNWTPTGAGRDFRFGKSHRVFEPLRNDLTVLGGLSHPKCRKMGGHDTADTWLTAAEMKEGHLKNTVSVDQAMAMRPGSRTRYSSLVLSTDGGVGEPTRASTLSFNRDGAPVPSENKPRLVFDRFFGANPDSLAARRRQLRNSGSMLDLILDHSHSLRGRLGKLDQAKLDEYLDSVRRIEQRVERSERWLEIPKPNVDASGLSLEADDSTPAELIRTMYDLIYLAFQTDSTRVATYQLGNMNGATSIAGKFPQLLGWLTTCTPWRTARGGATPEPNPWAAGTCFSTSSCVLPEPAQVHARGRRLAARPHDRLLRHEQQPDPRQRKLRSDARGRPRSGHRARPLPEIRRQHAALQPVRDTARQDGRAGAVFRRQHRRVDRGQRITRAAAGVAPPSAGGANVQ